MNENMLIQSLNHYCEEEIRRGPIGGMAWDQVDWDAHDIIEQYGWLHTDLENRWPELFKHR